MAKKGLTLILFIVMFTNCCFAIKRILFEDDFTNSSAFSEKWKTKNHFPTKFRYGGHRKEFKIKPNQHGKDAFIETEIPLHFHNSVPHLRIKATLIRKSMCDNHYLILRSESLTAKIPGQHPGVSIFTAGVGNVGGVRAHTGQMAYFGWKCDDKVMYLPKHNQSTTCTMHRKCNIDITVNKTNVIFKDQCGCKTLHTETYIWPRRKVLHLILGAHTILGASHGAVWKNIKVYSVEHPGEDDEELEEVKLLHDLHYHKNHTVGTTGKFDEDDEETYMDVVRKRRVAARIHAEMEDDGVWQMLKMK